MELRLAPNDNYLIQIKALSPGGEGVGSEPIHIHKLSEFAVVFSWLYHFLFDHRKRLHHNLERACNLDSSHPSQTMCNRLILVLRKATFLEMRAWCHPSLPLAYYPLLTGSIARQHIKQVCAPTPLLSTVRRLSLLLSSVMLYQLSSPPAVGLWQQRYGNSWLLIYVDLS